MDKDVVSRLVYSMIQFLQSQLDGGTGGGGLTEEGVESVEVAMQCLETAYGVSLAQTDLAPSRSLYQIFAEATRGEGVSESVTSTEAQKMDMTPPPAKEATVDEKSEAERLKNEGNQLMRDEKFTEALDCYTKAISKDSQNAVYYCNRAAAHSKLNSHREAIEDCKRALQIEPQYSKAYGRMGLAHSSLNEHREAKECYQRALELEPDNESYRGNLAIAEEKLQNDPGPQQQQPRANSLGGFGGGGTGGLPFSLGSLAGLGGSGGPDLSTMLSNPGFMNMATQLMSDPNMQNMMSNFMGSMGGMPGGAGGAGGGGAAPPSVPPPTIPPPTIPPPSVPPPNIPPPTAPPAGPGGATGGGLEALLNAGRQLAEQMQTQHPELVEQIRQQMNRGGGPGDGQGGNGNGGQDPTTPQ